MEENEGCKVEEARRLRSDVVTDVQDCSAERNELAHSGQSELSTG